MIYLALAFLVARIVLSKIVMIRGLNILEQLSKNKDDNFTKEALEVINDSSKIGTWKVISWVIAILLLFLAPIVFIILMSGDMIFSALNLYKIEKEFIEEKIKNNSHENKT